MQASVSRAETRELRRYRQFYRPSQIRESVSPELQRMVVPQAEAGDRGEPPGPQAGMAAIEILDRLSMGGQVRATRCHGTTPMPLR